MAFCSSSNQSHHRYMKNSDNKLFDCYKNLKVKGFYALVYLNYSHLVSHKQSSPTSLRLQDNMMIHRLTLLNSNFKHITLFLQHVDFCIFNHNIQTKRRNFAIQICTMRLLTTILVYQTLADITYNNHRLLQCLETLHCTRM